ncbi:MULTISPECIES: virulence factor Mce family protein [Mycobacterium avium complex (MAC)]|jgi:phospholipid/cholesterol/gamma-HCH transport system substrate-binding protein|uniref:MCE family protein n=18 Tax=Mycobacterium avium complex (MAC) TaxID=120793 RepID=A0A2A3L8C5_MYCAV|nr:MULTISPECIES: virulence factor Mce family protein [Mycobacterium avium complex (MAC)]ETA95957.1 mammalian cell entry protein [Mycobacterium avium 05-4293]EUA40039.1 mce related family protein [Mycobacterium avium subsp. avium 2285 (R)]ABK69234.1 mce-family protein mce1c [Mycobacterium avium 104]APA78192.1 MCE family protein [Mycobacterium avium subsp. hominissuis]APT13203.1 mammalian cell entry protein [Mycobacterium avium subsp. hominissuis]
MRTLEPPNRVRIGLMGIVVTVLVIGVGQSFTSVPMLFAKPSYYGQFTDSGGINTGDKVRIAGMDVGKVEGLKIDGDHIVVKFSIGTNTIGTESRLAIKTDTILGKKILDVEARGSQQLRPGSTLPLGQSTTPYQIYDAFFDVTKAAQGWDIETVKQSLHVLSQTIDQTYPHLSPALDGVAKFSDTIGKRDEQVKHLLAQANQVASVLGDRSDQIDRLLVNTKTLLAAFNERGQAINALLGNIAAFSEQVKGLINDNPNLNHVLEQLRTVSDILVQRKDDLANGLTEVGKFLPSLNEAIASGPFFKVVLHNLALYQISQPWVDAAFKKRGIDPEDFWRSAGLPAYRFPDPNGTRFPNGAPPPAPPVLEGTPDHPGPAVPPGSPCSYTPAADGLPRPDNPLPCAGAVTGPFGGPGFPAPVDVMTSPPNPAGLPPTPGIPIAGRPGDAPPDVPGTPVPLPTQAPPGARTENLAPAGPVPPPSTFAPGLPPGPPAPPGPGNQLPAPFINPGGTGGSGAAGGGSQN